MPKLTNEEKAHRVTRALNFTSPTKGEIPAPEDVRAILVDVMHYCNLHGLRFDYELSMATDAYSEERED